MYVKISTPSIPAGALLRTKSYGIRPDHMGVAGLIIDGKRSVIHNTARGVVVTSLEEFALRRAVEVVMTPLSPAHGAMIVARAYTQIGRPYSLLFANCEHFATWAFSGVPESPQLGRYIGGLLCALIVVGLANAGVEGGG